MIGTLGNLNYQIFTSDTTNTSIWRVRVRYHQRNFHLLREVPTTMVSRTHYQIMLWSLIDDFELKAADWEWKSDDKVIIPVTADKEITPESLTKVIRCNCKVCICEI